MSRINPANFYGYLDIRDVCQLLQKPDDVSARRLVWAQVRAREKRDGVSIWFQKAKNGKCKTTLPLLRNHMPEWFANRDHMAEMITERFDAYDEKLKRLELLIRALGARLRTTENACREHGIEW